MTKKIDRRINKTKKSIRDALMVLLSKKKLSDITITELSNTADINRKTFYSHYSSIENILESFSDELVQHLIVILDQHNITEANLNVASIFNSLNEVIELDFEFFDTVIRTDSYYVFVKCIKKYIGSFINETYSKLLNIDQALFSMYTEYIASGIINMYVEWFKSDRSISLEKLGEAAADITFNGIGSIISRSLQ